MAIHDATKGRRRDHFGKDPNDCIIIGLDTNDGPEHPLYDRRVERLKTLGRAAVADMIESLLRNKQISDVSCRQNGDTVETGCGKHRVFALRFIKAEKLSADYEVRVIYPRLTDDQWRDRIIAENLDRRDSDAFTEALAFADYVNARSVADLAKLIHQKQKTVESILALVQMPPAVQQIVTVNSIGRDVAIQAARLHTSEQEEFLRNFLAGGLQTATVAKAMVDEKKAKEGKITPPKERAPRTHFSVREVHAIAVAAQKGNLPQLPSDARMLLAAINGEPMPDEVPLWLTALLAAAGRGA